MTGYQSYVFLHVLSTQLFLQLSWIISSAEKLSILSVGRYTYTSDLRFQPVMRSDPSDNDSETWTLRVRRVREEDEAKYECQINTKPEKSRHIYLRVVGEFTEGCWMGIWRTTKQRLTSLLDNGLVHFHLLCDIFYPRLLSSK